MNRYLPKAIENLRGCLLDKRSWPSSLEHLLFLICLLGSTTCPQASEPFLGGQLQTPPNASANLEFFEKHVRPVLVEHCYACHSEQAAELEGGLSLESADGWLRGGERGPAIVPGQAQAGSLLAAMRSRPEFPAMPPDQPLPEEVIQNFEYWIAQGAVSPQGKYHPSVPAAADPEAGKAHWAYQPIRIATLPDRDESEWSKSPIDQFVMQKLQAHHLTPVADAPPAELLRRLYVQLTGLLPTLDEIEDFSARSLEDPLAIERVVERLLSSPGFGQRFGRHWLDLARFADSNGLDENFLFREAWRYRNWVIQAVNEDLPYDQFLLYQLAGDLLPYNDIQQRDRQRIAAGFLLVGPKVLLGNHPENQKMEVADEQIDTIGKSVLGQTLGCARCHDHKFDPVPTSDYYALAGIFTSTKVMQQRYMLGEQRVMEQLIGLGENGQPLNESYEAFWREQPVLKSKLEQARVVLDLFQKGQASEIDLALKEKPEGFADAARNLDLSHENRRQAQQAWVEELQAKLTPPAIPPRAMIPTDSEQPGDEFIRRAGQFDRKAEQVPRGFLQVLADEIDAPLPIPANSSGRMELARWLTDRHRRSGQLAARVLANRLWHHLFGAGLVRTVDNFGRTGDQPSHPELLDYLANRLIQEDWSIKALVREITLSRTFSLSSQHQVQAYETDPDNRWWWRYPRRRLDSESLRDTMLQLSDALDVSTMESTVSYLGDQATAVGENKVRRRTSFPCRTVYLPVIRNDLPEILSVFDFGDAHATTGARPITMVPAQALFMLNSDLVMETADGIARRLLRNTLPSGAATDPASEQATTRPEAVAEVLAQSALRHILQITPKPSEVRLVAEFWLQCLASDSTTPTIENIVEDDLQRATSQTCHAILTSSRFQFMQ